MIRTKASTSIPGYEQLLQLNPAVISCVSTIANIGWSERAYHYDISFFGSQVIIWKITWAKLEAPSIKLS